MLRDYHCIAWLTQQQGPEAHRRMLDKAAVIMHAGYYSAAVSIDDVKAAVCPGRWAGDIQVPPCTQSSCG